MKFERRKKVIFFYSKNKALTLHRELKKLVYNIASVLDYLKIILIIILKENEIICILSCIQSIY